MEKTMKEIAAVLGKTALLSIEAGLKVRVRVLDAKKAYGNLRYEVAPEGGEGQAWVDSSRVTIL